MLPYIDAGDRSGTGALAVVDKKTHLLLTRMEPGTYPANTTSGLSGRKIGMDGRPIEDVVEHCRHCNEHIDDCGDLWRVYRSGNNTDYQHALRRM